MKCSHKCAYCSRKADNKFQGKRFCNDDKKFLKRKRICSVVGNRKLRCYLPRTELGVYLDIPAYLK